jgi:hypothetical protein
MTELVDPMFDLFSSAIEDNSVANKQWTEILPDQQVSNSITTYDINTRNSDTWYQLADSYLEIRGNLVVASNSNPITFNALADAAVVALTNNAAANFFSRASLSFNGVSVEDVNYVGVSSLITGLSEYSQDHLDSHGSSMMFIPDDIDVASFTTNPSLKTRKNYSNSAGAPKQTVFFLPLKHIFGFCKHNQKAIRGLRTSLRLQVSDVNDMIFKGAATADVTSTFQYNHISLWMPQVVPNLVTLANIEKRLNSGAKIPVSFLSNDCYRSDASILQNRVYRVTTQTQAPRRIYVALQNSGVQNNQDGNNMAFQTKNLQEIYVRINGKQHPETAYQCDFTAGSENWVRAYNAFSQQKDDSSDGVVVSMQKWHDLYSIYVFDVSHQGDTPYQNVSTSDIEVHLKLRTAPTAAYVVYCCIQSERELAFTGSSSMLEVVTL